jgi:hypothetical protein
MRFVEVDMAINKRGQEERAPKIDPLAGRTGASRRMNPDNDAARDFNIGETALGEARVDEKHQTRFSRFAAAY